MAEQILIDKPYAYSRIIDRHLVMEPKLRVYRSQPDAIDIQIRTHTDKKGRVSGCGLTREEARIVGERLVRFAETSI